MNTKLLLNDIQVLTSLANRLSECEEVNRFDLGSEKEAWTIAHSLSDIEQSFNEINEKYLPSLIDPNIRGKDLINLLLDIGEELRHIQYHIKAQKFFEYIQNGDVE